MEPIKIVEYFLGEVSEGEYLISLSSEKKAYSYFKTNYDPCITISVLNNVLIHNDYFLPVLRDSGKALVDQAYSPCPVDLNRLSLDESHIVDVIDGPIILLGSSNGNHYHNVVNYMPRFFAVESCPDFSDLSFLVSSNPTEGTLSLIKAVTGVSEDRLVRRASGGHTLLRKAVIPSFFQNPIHSPLAINYIKRKLMGAFGGGVIKSKRVFISRKDAHPRRQIINEDILFDAIEALGFERFELAKLSMNDQISLFSTAEIIIAPHGAGLVNQIFCEKQPIIIELQNKNAFTRVFWSMSEFSRAKVYKILHCEEQYDSKRISNDRDITAPIEEILQVLAQNNIGGRDVCAH